MNRQKLLTSYIKIIEHSPATSGNTCLLKDNSSIDCSMISCSNCFFDRDNTTEIINILNKGGACVDE